MQFLRYLLTPAILPFLFGGILVYGGMSSSAPIVYDVNLVASSTPGVASSTAFLGTSTPAKPKFIVTHIQPPEPVKGAYMTSCIASGKKNRESLVKLVEATELNALIIDIKDYTGTISFDPEDKRFTLNTRGCFISDIKEFIGELHKKGIYVIGRVTVMQDATYPKTHPTAAVKKRSNGEIWKDKKGLMFIDPGATEYWEYMVALGEASYKVGFDEINYDYIRFPSDGDMSDIAFARTGSTTKSAMMRKFFSYLGKEMREKNIPISGDLFGMTTTNTDDLNIGQVLEDALRHFDYVAPMVYPSHYPPNFNGWKDPNLVPYDIIKFSMSRAVARANALEKKESGFVDPPPVAATSTATTTQPKFVPTGKYANKLRPWIQDFDYGKNYTEKDVRDQKRGVYDAGLTSWMTWDPSNRYTPSAYDPVGE